MTPASTSTVPTGQIRAEGMAALRAEGFSLNEIALRFEVSRERVRQILRTRSVPDPADVAAARRRRAMQGAEAQIDELLRRWRAGETPSSAATALGLQAVACRSAIARFATELDRASRSASFASARAVTKTYSDRDIVIALTTVADRLGKVPSAREYSVLARQLQYASLPTVLNRMDGWTNAVRAAGLTRAPGRTPPRSRRWTEGACWAALRQVVAELGELPTVLAYERYAAGRADLPSSATLRVRLGRWSTLTTRLTARGEAEPSEH
jgi:hypothetical protein